MNEQPAQPWSGQAATPGLGQGIRRRWAAGAGQP
jgi:hypothetical protein